MRTGYLFLALAFLGCSSSSPSDSATEPQDDDFELIPDGKADNYRSPAALEFSATADAIVVLDESMSASTEEERAAAAQELISAKLLQIGWFLNLWVSDKEPEDANKDYGSYHAMARNASVEALKIEPVDKLTYKFNFEATLAAQNDFLKIVPGENQASGGKLVVLNMGKLSNEELLGGNWQGAYGVHSWNPATVDPSKLEVLKVLIKPIERSSNAWLNYPALYEDGKLIVGVQFGFDYNAGRADLSNARQIYEDLLAIGFKSPVDRYDDLKLDSAPLTRTSLFGDRTVDIEVKLVHPGMVASPSANAVDLRNALLDMLANREVVLFNGHAGVSGRLLPADFQSTSAGNILPTEYPTMKLYPGFQLLLIEGCQTYARFTDGFRQNPAKKGPNGELVNMDIVTSTSYTWTTEGANTIETILFPLVGQNATTKIKPVTWDDVLREMNAPPNETAFMGVNGIDNDPHGHPYGRTDLLGTTCKNTTACGGLGNACMRVGSSGKVCATLCIDDKGCPSDYRCAKIASSGTIAGNACVKR